MVYPENTDEKKRSELANSLFFRLYQCANMLHKTGTHAVAAEGLTSQQWAVLGALGRAKAAGGMGVGELAGYLMVSRQNLAGLLHRMGRDGHVTTVTDPRDRRSRLVTMTANGREVWEQRALPKIHAYYEEVLADLSTRDMDQALGYFVRILDNMQRLDFDGRAPQDEGD